MIWDSIMDKKTLREFAEEVCNRYGAVLSYGLLLRLAMIVTWLVEIVFRSKRESTVVGGRWLRIGSNALRQKFSSCAFKRYLTEDMEKFGKCDTLGKEPAPPEEVECGNDIEAAEEEFQLDEPRPSRAATSGKRKRRASSRASSRGSSESNDEQQGSNSRSIGRNAPTQSSGIARSARATGVQSQVTASQADKSLRSNTAAQRTTGSSSTQPTAYPSSSRSPGDPTYQSSSDQPNASHRVQIESSRAEGSSSPARRGQIVIPHAEGSSASARRGQMVQPNAEGSSAPTCRTTRSKVMADNEEEATRQGEDEFEDRAYHA
ncbi:unnamed protein product [Tilletia laevis]|nr:unnamed protein product [Tilletia laevis]